MPLFRRRSGPLFPNPDTEAAERHTEIETAILRGLALLDVTDPLPAVDQPQPVERPMFREARPLALRARRRR